jgi:hypothetical protein
MKYIKRLETIEAYQFVNTNKANWPEWLLTAHEANDVYIDDKGDLFIDHEVLGYYNKTHMIKQVYPGDFIIIHQMPGCYILDVLPQDIFNSMYMKECINDSRN